MKQPKTIFCVAAAAAALLSGCAGTYQGVSATAELEPRSGSQVQGKIHFSQHANGIVKVAGQISGLQPNSAHGFHIHEKGDCSSADGNSAGPHFNPHNSAHGPATSTHSHVGDLPNLQANNNGMAIVQWESDRLQLTPGNANIVERSVVVHAQPDDLHSQPAGNAGARIACGVIKLQ